jgi:Ca2+-binding RTX toxin-like protein
VGCNECLWTHGDFEFTPWNALKQKFGNYQDDIDTQLSGLWGTFKDFESLFTVAFSANKITFTYFAGRIELGGNFVLNSGNGSILSRIQGRIDQEVFFKDAPTPYTRYELTELDLDFQDIFSKTWGDILSGHDFIEGGLYTDFRLSSYAGNDTIIAGGGSDVIDGGQGRDTVIFSGQRSGFTLVMNEDSATLRSSELSNDSISLRNIERLSFLDSAVAFDTDGATSAGGIYRLYKATFNREPDTGGLGYWIAQADTGNKDAVRMAEDFVWSQEFQNLYGIQTTDNYGTGNNIRALIEGFYENVLGRTPDEGGLNFYTGVIESKDRTVGRVLAEISDSQENYDGTIELIANGIVFEP